MKNKFSKIEIVILILVFASLWGLLLLDIGMPELWPEDWSHDESGAEEGDGVTWRVERGMMVLNSGESFWSWEMKKPA